MNDPAKVVATRTSLADLGLLGDPVLSYNFDVVIGDKNLISVQTAKVDTYVALRFVVIDNQEYPDLSGKSMRLSIYQKEDKRIDLFYDLTKLVGVHLSKLDGSVGNDLIYLEQLYEYNFYKIQ